METDVVVAVMGLTGAGKSSFIKNITGRDDIVIGHSLTSQTSEIAAYNFQQSNRRYVLVDTPGFDDTFQSNDVITQMILQWLESSYRAGTKLNAIMYLHSISQPRLTGSAYENLCMFRKLCGDDGLAQVVLATTFWDHVSPVEGDDRVRQLKEDNTLWGKMFKAGSQVVKLENSQTSALDVLAKISTTKKMVTQAQREMVDQGKKADQTTAGLYMAWRTVNVVNDQRAARVQRLRADALQQSEHLSTMREKLETTDQQLNELREEAEKARANQVRANEEVRSQFLKAQRRHRCRCKLDGRAKCTTCRRVIRDGFHHCCFCTMTTRRTFLQCASCGDQCQILEHPQMKYEETYCVVM